MQYEVDKIHNKTLLWAIFISGIIISVVGSVFTIFSLLTPFSYIFVGSGVVVIILGIASSFISLKKLNANTNI